MTKQVRYAESGSVNAVTVVDYIVERLAAEGISHCFGVAGDYLFPICDAVDSSSNAGHDLWRRRTVGHKWCDGREGGTFAGLSRRRHAVLSAPARA